MAKLKKKPVKKTTTKKKVEQSAQAVVQPARDQVTTPASKQLALEIEPFICLIRTKSADLVRLENFEALPIVLDNKPHVQLRWEFTGSIGYSSRYSIGSIISSLDIEKALDNNSALELLSSKTVQYISGLQQKYIGV
jgi:hypothetical protein